ncbi:MAG: DUF4421 family protein [Bacteroidaceae bacterium]|nr:DUF4421 family protein [Bacteroidaceae bacterium]
MKKYLNIRASLCFVFVMSTLTMIAQTKREMMRERIDSAVTARYYSGKYDTTYIQRPQETWLLKLRDNVSGSRFHADRHLDGVYWRGRLKTDMKATMSVGVNYRGITAGLALNPGKLSGKNKDFEINLNAYANRYGIDVVYQNSKTLSGPTSIGEQSSFLEKGMMGLKMLNINGYYAFNGKRFSYPAAFTQSYIQRRSAGSWLVGFSYMGGSLKTTEKVPDYASTMRIYIGHFGIGGGYGYNWVPGKRWLLHFSALPTLVIGNYNNIKVDGVRQDMDTKFPDLILTERAAIVYTINKKYFLASTLVVTNSLLGDDVVDINYSKWRARLCLGMRL